MKRSLFFLSAAFLSFSLLLASCDNKTDYRLKNDEVPSLRNKIVYMDNKTDWTEPLDRTLETNEKKETPKTPQEEILAQIALAQNKFKEREEKEKEKEKKAALPAGFSESSVQNRLFIPKDSKLPELKYPELRNFASLDTRKVDPKISELVDKFVECMNKNELDVNCVAENSRFLKPVFEYDFSLLDSIESYIIGKPFIVKNESVDEYQLPVRLLTKETYIDAVFFLVSENNKYYIEQIYYRGFYDE